MNNPNPKVDFYFEKAMQWREELAKLRTLVLGCSLAEDLKWGKPCYSVDGGNVVLIHEFKDYCALLFIKGVLLKDPAKILVQQTENVQAARQIRFNSAQQIVKLKATLKAYIEEAVKIEKAGLRVELKKTAEFAMPDEFKTKLESNRALKSAFESLTPGRQRAYILYFAGAKQSKTRQSRVDQWTKQILDGKGLDD